MNIFKNEVSYLDFHCLKSKILSNTDKIINKFKNQHDRKLRNLGINACSGPLDPNKVIFNLSNKPLSNIERNLLAFGLNFKLPIFKLDYFKYFLSFEKIFNILKK